MQTVPSIRIRQANDAPVNDRGDYVLYWMIANRRTEWNFALDRAVDRAIEMKKPLVVLDALRAGYRWASDRLHTFILEAMDGHRRTFEESGVCCHAYVEPASGEGRGLVESLGKRACLVVTDEFPCFFLPRMVEKAADILSVHQIFDRISWCEDWSFDRLSPSASGGRSGWWGMSDGAEAFLDQLVTWRELGFNMCMLGSGWDRYDSLPEWALSTLRAHESDPRTFLYRLEDFEAAKTHDPLWNAAQTQLATEGRIHNYLRMLRGKKILEWSETPRSALEVMVELNNKYAMDGRDPNSYSGIFWVMGRYDRAWGPERPVFGKIRYMSSENTARKLRVKGYVSKYKS